eukprot:383617-Karenia_brevis.AAC.1
MADGPCGFALLPEQGQQKHASAGEHLYRKAYAVPIKDKTPEVTATALRAMLNRLGTSPVIISSDAGNEFTGA